MGCPESVGVPFTTYLAVVGEAKVVKSEVIDHGENDVSRRGCGAPAWREKRERERCHYQIIEACKTKTAIWARYELFDFI